MMAAKPNPTARVKPIPSIKKKRNQPGTPDPEAEVVALSPKSLMATNRFVCEICGKGFQRDQNLQLHRRGHNLPWKLCHRGGKEAARKKVYVCPEPSCVHHHPSRALGDLTGIKKHFSRKHGEKRWKCERCSKKYAVHSDWKAHSKTCGTRDYKCDCGTLFSRKDSFITHRAFCDALADERVMMSPAPPPGDHSRLNLSFGNDGREDIGVVNHLLPGFPSGFGAGEESAVGMLQFLSELGPGLADHYQKPGFSPWLSERDGGPLGITAAACFGHQGLYPSSSGNDGQTLLPPPPIHADGIFGPAFGNACDSDLPLSVFKEEEPSPRPRPSSPAVAPMSATALLQKAAQMGSAMGGGASSAVGLSFTPTNSSNICSSSPSATDYSYRLNGDGARGDDAQNWSLVAEEAPNGLDDFMLFASKRVAIDASGPEIDWLE